MNVRARTIFSNGKSLFSGVCCTYNYRGACINKRPAEGHRCDAAEGLMKRVERAQFIRDKYKEES